MGNAVLEDLYELYLLTGLDILVCAIIHCSIFKKKKSRLGLE